MSRTSYLLYTPLATALRVINGIILLSVFGVSASAQELFRGGLGDKEIVVTRSILGISVTFPSGSELSTFPLDNPHRIVIDAKHLDIPPTWRTLKGVSDSLLKKIRVAAHPGKVRVILDVSDEATNVNTLVTGEVVTITSAEGADKLIETVTVLPEGVDPAPFKEEPSELEPTLPNSLTEEQRALSSIDFETIDDEHLIAFRLTQPAPIFELSRRDALTFVLTIPHTAIATLGLALPQYPPQQFTGITFVHALGGDPKLMATIGVEKGVKLTAVPNGNVVFVKIDALEGN